MKKIKKVLAKIENNLKLLWNFGFVCSFYDFFDSIIFREKGALGKYFHLRKHEYVKKYIKTKYKAVIEKYKSVKKEEKYIEKNCYIFIFWWQGEKNAPEIVQSCINSVKRHAGKHIVKVIDKNNYIDYVNIPDYIIKNFNEGKISITHFSDILRFNLLYVYGGIWMDATVYLTKDFDNDIFKHKFYTVHHNQHKTYHVCKGLWSTSFIACGKNNQLVKFIIDILNEYLKDNKIFICYLLIDCLLALAYENIDVFNLEISNIPVNNIDFFELEKILSEEFNLNKIKKFKNTYMFKTTYRINFLKEINNKTTFYNEILNGNI